MIRIAAAQLHHSRRTLGLVAVAATSLLATTLGGCSTHAPQAVGVAGTPTPVATSSVSVPGAPATAGAPRATAVPVAAPRPAATTATTTATATTATRATTAVAHPATDPSGIDWRQVGPGWTVVSSTTSTMDRGHYPGPFTLSLVSPTGVRYPRATLREPLWLQDVSPDGKRALAFSGTGEHPALVEWDLAARTSRTVPLGAAQSHSVQYTRPSGAQLIVSESGVGGARVVRMTLAGHVEASYETGTGGQVASTSDGTRVVTTAATGDALRVLDNATAHTLRTVSAPTGYEHCAPVRRWSGADVEVQCGRKGTQSVDLFALSTATGTLRALTHTDPATTDELFGYGYGWPLAGGVLAMRATGCGPGAIGLVDHTGRIGSELTWPGTSYPPQITGVAGTRVYALVSSCGNAPTVLMSQDVLTHRTTTLGRGSLLSVAMVQDS